MKQNKTISLLLAALLLLGMLSGCGSVATTAAETAVVEDDAAATPVTAETEAETPAAASAAESATATASVTIAESEHEPLTLYSAQNNYKYFVDALKEVYPEINLEIISYKGGNTSSFLKQQLEHGDLPDIYVTNYMQDADLQTQYLLDLSGYDFVNNYADTMLNSVDVDGKLYLLPSRYSVAGINYNKTMFEEHGWEVPQSFEELNDLVAQIEEEAPEITPILARMNLKGYPFHYLFALGSTDFLGTPAGAQWKQDFLNGDTTAVGNLESSVAYLQEWIDRGYITDYDLDSSDMMADFYDGKVAMVLNTGTARWTGVGKTTGETIEVGLMAWPGENGNHGMLISNVARYYGLNKELGEAGNEQKLEDALKVMAFMATDEGQVALASGARNSVAFPLKDYQVDEDSYLYEVSDYINDGYTVPLTYEGWEAHLLVPMADELINLIQGNIDGEELLRRFDEISKQVQEDPDSFAIAVADEELTTEQVARLSGVAMMEYTGADVSLVSVSGITEDLLENSSGAQCGIYAGNINEEVLNIFRPVGTALATIDLTGAEIQALVDSGRQLRADPEAIGTEYTYLDHVVEYAMPYVLTVRGDAELDPDATYTVVFSRQDIFDDLAEEWGDRLTTIDDANAGTAITAWLEARPDGHFGSADIKCE